MEIKSSNRSVRYNFILIAIVLMMSFLTGCTGKESNAEISDYSRAVIEKNNNIYLYGNDEGYLDIVGDVSKQKQLEALSDDNKYIAFKYIEDTDRIIIYDIENNTYRELSIDNSANYQITGIRWLKDKIAVSLYVDKDTNETLIYDYNTGKIINTCKGILIDIVDNGNNIVYGKTEDGKTKIYLGKNELYELENTAEMVVSGTVSDNGEIGFITFYYDRASNKQKEFLYTGKLVKSTMKDVKRYEKPYEITGDVIFDGRSVFIRTEYGIYKLQDEKFVLSDNEKQVSAFKESVQNIIDIFRKTFVSENIRDNSNFSELGIYNIIWFNK